MFFVFVDESDCWKLPEEFPHREQWEDSLHRFLESDSQTHSINNREKVLLKHRLSAIKHVLKYLR